MIFNITTEFVKPTDNFDNLFQKTYRKNKCETASYLYYFYYFYYFYNLYYLYYL